MEDLTEIINKTTKNLVNSNQTSKSQIEDIAKHISTYTKNNEDVIHKTIENATERINDGEDIDTDAIINSLPDITPEAREEARKTLNLINIAKILQEKEALKANKTFILINKSRKCKAIKILYSKEYYINKYLHNQYEQLQYRSGKGNYITIYHEGNRTKLNKAAKKVTGLDLYGDVLFFENNNLPILLEDIIC